MNRKLTLLAGLILFLGLSIQAFADDDKLESSGEKKPDWTKVRQELGCYTAMVQFCKEAGFTEDAIRKAFPLNVSGDVEKPLFITNEKTEEIYGCNGAAGKRKDGWATFSDDGINFFQLGTLEKNSTYYLQVNQGSGKTFTKSYIDVTSGEDESLPLKSAKFYKTPADRNYLLTGAKPVQCKGKTVTPDVNYDGALWHLHQGLYMGFKDGMAVGLNGQIPAVAEKDTFLLRKKQEGKELTKEEKDRLPALEKQIEKAKKLRAKLGVYQYAIDNPKETPPAPGTVWDKCTTGSLRKSDYAHAIADYGFEALLTTFEKGLGLTDKDLDPKEKNDGIKRDIKRPDLIAKGGRRRNAQPAENTLVVHDSKSGLRPGDVIQ